MSEALRLSIVTACVSARFATTGYVKTGMRYDSRLVIATYRLQLTADFGFGDALELVPYLKCARRSATSTSRPRSRRAPARRTATTSIDPARISEEKGGEEAFRRLCSAGLCRPAGHRPEPHGRLRRESLVGGRARSGRRSSTSTRDGPLAPLLRHRRARRRPRRGRGGLRADAREDPPARRGGARRGAADRPSGRPRRPGRLPRAAARARRPSRLGGEDLRGRRAPPRLADRRDRRLRVPERGAGALRRARGRGRAHRALREFTGELRSFHDVAYEAKLEQATTTFEPEVERLRGADRPARSCRRRSPPSRSTARTSSRGTTASTRPTASRSRAAQLSDQLRRVLLLEERGHDEFVSRFQQTTGPVMAKGRRGHGLLPLQPARSRSTRWAASPAASGSASRSCTSATSTAPRACRARSSRPRRTTRSAPATSARASAR